MKSKYSHLFEPLKVGNIVLKNRIISAPLGSLTDKSISGIGMIIRGTSGSVPGSRSRVAPGPYCFENMLLSAKVREQVITIQQRGAKAEFELCHVGQYAKVKPGDYAIGPNGYIREDGVEVKAMTKEMMEEVANDFAKGAMDAKEYGFDMVMLHFAHGWLPTQFLSPYYNKRTDEFGGSFENRIKFPMMIVEKVRQAVGPDYPLDMRISLDEHIDGGTSTEEIIEFLKRIEDKIDMVHVSAGIERDLDAMSYMSAPSYYPHQINTVLSKKVKENLNIPVAVVGSIMTPQEAENILINNEADAVVIGRQLIADPYWVTKAWENREEDIVPCLRCLNCYNMYQGKDDDAHSGMKSILCCSVNPRYLHESTVPNKLEKAQIKKNVAIIGGGPAGMKAALTAEQRGHNVTIFEKNSYLGGQLHCADFDDAKQDLKRYKDYLINQVEKSKITVKYNSCVNKNCKELENYDAIIVAIGASPKNIKLEGLENAKTYNALEAYEHLDEITGDVVVIGGGSIGSELAKCISHKAHKVSIVEAANKLGGQINEHIYAGLMHEINQCKNIEVYLNHQCIKYEDGNMLIKQNDNIKEIKADYVIVAIGMYSHLLEANEFYGIVQDTNVIGDAKRVGTVYQATSDGYYSAASL